MGTELYASIGGILRAHGRADERYRILITSLRISNIVDDAPNRAQFTAMGFVPSVGERVIIAQGDITNERLFAGCVLSVQQGYVTSNPANQSYQVSCIDDTWRLNRRKVIGQFTGSATDIVLDLMAEYAPDFTTTNVVAGLPTVDGGIVFTNQNLTDCLTQVAKRIGGYWYLDYDGDLHFFLAEAGDDPDDLTDSHPTMRSVRVERDLSQVITRVWVEGGGGTVLAEVEAGETILPVSEPSWYNPAGALVICGPQRIAYTGLDEGGQGSLVGPGAAPNTAPAGVLADGSGVEDGAHQWAYTFVTGSGETVPSPLLSLTVGSVDPPSAAPTPGAPTAGSGVNTGDHQYAVTFTNAAGETTSSPLSSVVTTGPVTTGFIAAPVSSPTAGAVSSGGNVDPGTHLYAVTFINGAGETTAGPTTSKSVPEFSAPSGGPTATYSSGTTGNLSAGTGSQSYFYSVTFVTSAGETTAPSPTSGSIPLVTASGGGVTTGASAGGSIDVGGHTWKTTLVTASGETAEVSSSNSTISAPNQTMGISRPVTGDARVTHWRVYRSKANTSSPLYLVATVAIGTSSYSDSTADASLPGTTIPVSDTASTGQMALTSIPTGASGTTARKIYRGVLGSSSPLKLVTTIGDNSTTTYTDNVADGSLGVNAPSSNTATIDKTVALSSIPTGPTGTTGRRIYRTVAGGSQLKLVATISNNSATTYSDTTADASLGANVPVSNTTATTTNFNVVPLTSIPIGPANVTSRKLYRTAAGGSQLKFLATIADNSTTTYNDSIADGSLGSNIPVTNTADANRVSLTSISAGPSGTTSRKVYRTVAAGSQLKLLTTIGDNTTTTYTDSTADASLSTNAPTSDTSGLAQPAGQVLAGATTIPVASAGLLPSAGWVILAGNQVVRYTGKTGTSITGVPASGPGSIGATVSYSSTIVAAPQLKGVTGILYTLPKGEDINLLVQVDDLAAQAAIGAMLVDANGDPTDGIHEDSVQDRRLSEAEALARGQALLALRSSVETTLRYQSRDTKTRAGRTIVADLTDPMVVSGTFKIQSVEISFTTAEDKIDPFYDVVASTTRFSFEDLLRQVRR